MIHSLCCIQPTFPRKHAPAQLHVFFLLFSLVVSTGSSFAQSTFGAFVGTVKDPQGATIAGATVKLINVGTSTARETITSSTGQYAFLNVEPGSYRILVESAG